MNKALFILLCLFNLTAFADFDDASEAYANKQYQHAFEEFHRLAKIGNKRAQFNVGVMYLNGEYVEQNLSKAYAWGKLSEHKARPEFSQIAKTLENQLSADALIAADQEFQQLNKKYGDTQIFAQLSPITTKDNDEDSEKSNYSIEVIERKAPFYPKDALSKGIQGWVTLGFEVYPDGSVREPYIIESFPEGVFDRVTIDSVLGFKFKTNFDEGIEPFPVMATQTIEYEMKTRDSASTQNRLKQLYQQRLNRLKRYAEEGSAQAQYVYAISGSANIIPKETRISDEEVNEWLLQSAQNGHLQAQYHLGRNILRGKGCQVEKQKGIDWIVYAAAQGHPQSSRLAYQLLTKHDYLNNTDKPAEHWLKMAAENGDADAQLDYAHHLVFNTDEANQHVATARDLIEKHRKNRAKSVKYHQVAAQLYRLENNDKKAEKELKKANKLAKKLGWKT